MPEITMCDNASCPKRENCYRSTAEPSAFYQSYAHFEPRWKFNSFVCDYYIPLKEAAVKTERKEAA